MFEKVSAGKTAIAEKFLAQHLVSRAIDKVQYR